MTTPAISGGPILRPEEVGALVVQPALIASVAAETTTVVSTQSHDYRVPLVITDPVAAWVAEGAEITPSDIDVDELLISPAKLAGLTKVSRELAEDSDPAAASVIGDGLARDIARRMDQAFYAGLVAPAAPGLPSVTGAQTVINAAAFGSIDYFLQAISKAETVGAKLSAFVVNPATALTLAQLKQGTGSNVPLLQPDPTQPTRRLIGGVPLYVSPSVAANTAWGYDGSRIFTVVRAGSTLEIDRSVYFTSDQVAIKATMRVGYAFAHPASIVKIATA